ncbi:MULTISPECIES: hypothetical protein [unclassified Bradyrhizobium]
MRDLITAGRIEAYEKCSVLGELVTYAFYGRAAFRGKFEFAPTTLSALFPSVLILDPATVPTPAYVFPFDSGAFVDNMMDAFLHPYMPLFDFLLAPDIQSAAKLVTAVFGTNENFLRNTPLMTFDVPSSNFEADCYKKLALANGATSSGDLDDRASTPEIIFKDAIELRKSVVAAVLPDTLAADAKIGGALRAFDVDVYDYVWTSGSRPGENHFVVRNLIQTIYRRQGWL